MFLQRIASFHMNCMKAVWQSLTIFRKVYYRLEVLGSMVLEELDEKEQ
jgi:hypothetical protein